MGLTLEYRKHVLNFKFDAKTSRGVLHTKDTWILKISINERSIYGLGEVSVIDRLSFDYNLDFEKELDLLKSKLFKCDLPADKEGVYQLVSEVMSQNYPAIRFGLETALLDLVNGGGCKIFDNSFFHSSQGVLINGLIWMGDEDFMKKQIDEKLKQGFKCIKIKIGAIDFDTECEILEYIRSQYSSDILTLRVDANGAFLTQDVLKKLEKLARYDLHSIEQPIMPRQPQAMRLICEKSKIPIALDEELIGIFEKWQKIELLEEIRPAFIILKPALLGGFKATHEWIEIAERLNIKWWVTSALESNIGLNAICQFTAEYEIDLYQGLGTGQLFDNNFHSPLYISEEQVRYNPNLTWDYSVLNF